MHHRRHRAFRRRQHGIVRGWYDRERVLERLEEYQRDLEQELADVSDLITRLRSSGAGETSEATATV